MVYLGQWFPSTTLFPHCPPHSTPRVPLDLLRTSREASTMCTSVRGAQGRERPGEYWVGGAKNVEGGRAGRVREMQNATFINLRC